MGEVGWQNFAQNLCSVDRNLRTGVQVEAGLEMKCGPKELKPRMQCDSKERGRDGTDSRSQT